MASIVDPPPDGKTEFGPGHPYWPCPICAGLRPTSVSPLIRAKHIEHTTPVTHDALRCICGHVDTSHVHPGGCCVGDCDCLVMRRG